MNEKSCKNKNISDNYRRFQISLFCDNFRIYIYICIYIMYIEIDRYIYR